MRSRQIAASAKQEIEAINGITDVRTNPGAGAIVICFDTREVDVDTLEEQIEKICKPAATAMENRSKRVAKQLNRVSKIGMVSTLALSVRYGVMGRKRPHIAYGSAFLALATLHMLKHSKHILR